MAYSIDNDLSYDSRTLTHIWRQRVEESGDEPCVWFDESWLTWRELDRRSLAFSTRLAGAAIAPGERVCVLMENSPDTLVVLLAIWRRGLVAVPLSVQMVGPLLTDRLRSIGPAAVVVDAARVDDLEAASDGIEYERFIGIDTAERDGAGAVPTYDSRYADDAVVSPADTALILFTSGSTGAAKGCVMSHHYAIYYAWVFWRYMAYGPDDVLYTCLPLNHCHALFSSWWPSVLAGGRFALGTRFSASGYWREVAQSGATGCSTIGMMTSILLSRPVDEWESKVAVRIAHIAAEDAPVAKEFEQRFQLRAVTSRYGSTEAMVFPPLLEMPAVPGLIGPAPADFDVALVDSDGRDVGDGTGELLVRPRIPHTMFAGYHDRPDATLEAFAGLWFHTGDLLRRDSIGHYWFVGRASDTIRRRGENVSAWEVERSVAQHPLVEQVAALAIPSALNGEEICVVVVPRPGTDLSADAVDDHAAKMLPRYMRPDQIWIRHESLPRTQSDKVDKPALRTEYLAEPFAVTTTDPPATALSDGRVP